MRAQITQEHREKTACVYLRQSTPGQLRLNRESTERQYGLKDKALELGWASSMIRVMDRDLGLSGTTATNREDFKELVTEVSMNRVGAVLSLEASRLSRSCADWHRLLELCALTGTLIIDEDGIYDPRDFNDQLLLGLKGTMSQAELHFLRARLQGGKLNKARKGELRFPLPVGLCYDDEGNTVLDPDEEVRGVVRLFFTCFQEIRSAYGVVRRFARDNIPFPKRAYGGAWNGKLIWGRLEHGRALSLLRNPSYAGCYVFGRYGSKKQILSDGRIVSKTSSLPMDSWQVVIHDHHEGYTGWEEYLRNQKILQQNRTNGEENVLSGPAREGHALLQGLLLCGKCGRRITVRYRGNGGIRPIYECNWHHRQGLAGGACMSVRCCLIDQPVCQRVLELFEPAQLQIALHAIDELKKREQAVQRQWRMRIERADYQAQLAQRRYEEVDPANRLVASTLEKRWNDALENLDLVKEEYANYCRQEDIAVTSKTQDSILALANDLPRVWDAPSTKNKDRKEMLRLIIMDITMERLPEARQVLLHIRWQGGLCEDIAIDIPLPAPERLRYKDDLVAKVRELACDLADADIASTLNGDGLVSAKGRPFSASMVQWIRHKHKIPVAELRQPEELTVKETAEKFRVSAGVVYYWAQRGIVASRKTNNGSRCWITIDAGKEEELKERVGSSSKIPKQSTC
ncbi:MAG: recombinase family protein [Lentisphaeria bacterium]|nr:recombinase family protein [Lentisphaeria bacterium]